MPTYTPIASSETLDRTNWYYIAGNTQDDTDTNYQPRDPFADTDGVSENIITFWGGGGTSQHKIISYKNPLNTQATITFKLIRGGGGTSQPTYNIKLANSTTARVFHTGTYDMSTLGVIHVSTATDGFDKNATWTIKKTISFSDISNTGWTEISQTVTGSNYYIAIRQPTSNNFGGWAIADVSISVSDVSYDKSPDVLRGFLIPYPINSQTAIWDSEKSFTQQNPRAGTAEPQQATGLTILTTGTQEDEANISIKTERAGSTNAETGKKASFLWAETNDIDTSPYGWDYPTSIQGYDNIQTGSSLVSIKTPDVLRVSDQGDDILLIVYADTITTSKKVAVKKVSTSGTVTTTTLFSTPNTLSVDYNPCICSLSNGDILVAFWYAGTSSTNAQIITYISRDNGGNWTQSSTNALNTPLDISTASGYTPKKTRIIANEQQVLIVCHLYANFTTSTVRNRVFSAASSNQGASYKVVEVERFSSGNQAFYGLFLNKNNQFSVCFLKGNDGNEATLYTIPHAYFPLTNATINSQTIFNETEDIFYMNPSTYEIEKGLNAEIVKDEDGTVYSLFRHIETSDKGSYFMMVSPDEDNWYFQSGATGLSDNRYLYRSDEVDSTLNEMKITPYRGRLAILSNFKSKNQSGTVENSLIVIYLGGYSDRTLTSSDDVETPIYKSIGLYDTYVPFDLPQDTGLFTRVTLNTGESIINNRLNLNTTTDRLYYRKESTATPSTGLLIRTSLKPISGGGDSAMERAIYLQLVDSTAGDSYLCQIRISTNKVVVYDETAAAEMGEYSFGTDTHIDILISMYSNQILVYVANQHRVFGGLTKKQYTLVNSSDTSLQNGGSPSITQTRIDWGHVGVVTAETDWYEFHMTLDTQYTNFLTNNSPLLSREYPNFGTFIYINGGLRITTKDSPTYKNDRWDIVQTADYPIEKIFFSESPNTDVYWRSTAVTSGNVAACFIPILLDSNITTGTGSNYGMGNDLIAFHLEGVNFRNFFIKYRDGVSNIWSVVANVDTSSGLTGNFTREGATIVPSDSTANPNPFFGQYGEFIGAIAELDDGGGTIVRRRISMNSSGVFSNVNSQRLTIKLESPDSTDPSSGTLRIIPEKITVVISANNTKGVAWAIDIPAQETIDNFFSLSNLTFGEVAIFSPQYGRGRSITFQPNSEIFESPDGTLKPKKRGKGRRIARISWTDGVDTRDIYGNLENLSYYKSSDSLNSQPVGTWGDIPLKIQGIYKYSSGDKPVVYLPYIEYSTTSLGNIRVINRNENHIFGLLDGGMSFDHVIGNEYTDEVHRIATLIIREIV